ncbi:MAG TPA: hypothetical protein VME21_10000 [Steroidobacteraceae bacterium]|nr:hypothetical protein [Steroidobacteraceae bacterium]
MHIAFLTSCLAPGKDGVGDYIRDLTAGCRALGHECSGLALNDRHVEAAAEELQPVRDSALACLRLPATASWSQRMSRADEWLARRAPDWVSVQLVSYGFHPKGLPFGLAPRLAALAGRRHRHLLLHELWVGMDTDATLRRRLLGAVQRHLVLDIARQLRPEVVHTTNDTYAQLLSRWAIDARVLPLCGNIPVAAATDPGWLEAALLRAGVPASRARPSERTWRCVIFGSLHPRWHPDALFVELGRAAEEARRELVIISIGRRGAGDGLWSELRRRYGERHSFALLGERSPLEISSCLAAADFGIALTPWALIGKSGTTAALTDHGLPVIVARTDEHYAGVRLSPPGGRFHAVDGGLSEWMRRVRREPPCSRLAQTSEQFVADLQRRALASCRASDAGSVASMR